MSYAGSAEHTDWLNSRNDWPHDQYCTDCQQVHASHCAYEYRCMRCMTGWIRFNRRCKPGRNNYIVSTEVRGHSEHCPITEWHLRQTTKGSLPHVVCAVDGIPYHDTSHIGNKVVTHDAG